jgi:phosphoribosylglycinamide formyltransferase-1
VREKGLALEWQLYPACIQLFAEGRLKTVRMTYTQPQGRTLQRTVVKIAV